MDEKQYIDDVLIAIAHPVRTKILKALKESPKTTSELIKITGVSDRRHLYYHLDELSGSNKKKNKTPVKLIKAEKINKKTNLYSLLPLKTYKAILVLDSEDIEKKPKEFSEFIRAMSDMEGEKIPNVKGIARVEIVIHYS